MLLHQVRVRKHDRIYNVSRFAVANYACDVGAGEGKQSINEETYLANAAHRSRLLVTYLLHPLSRSISIELYSANPFPISTSSHSFISYTRAEEGNRREETLLVSDSSVAESAVEPESKRLGTPERELRLLFAIS